MDGPKDFALEKSDGFRKSFDMSKDIPISIKVSCLFDQNSAHIII